MIECKAVIPMKVGKAVIELIMRDLTAAFGGLQSYTGAGLWSDPDQGGRVVAEEIATIIAAIPSAIDWPTFQEIVENHCRDAGERYLYMAHHCGHATIKPLKEKD